MKRGRWRTWQAVLVAVLLGGLAGLLAFHCSAHAQPGPVDEHLELVHAYARVFVSEGGWENAGEHAALAWTLRRRAERLRGANGWSELRSIREYSTAATVRPRTERGRWIVALPIDGVTQPDGWPRGARWSSHVPLWQAALERARQHVRGELADPCSGPSEHWGSREHPVDVARARRAIAAGRWTRVDCSGGGERTLNAFFAVRAR